MTWLRSIEARSLRHLEHVEIDLTPSGAAPRSHLVLLGANASGKTTLLAEIADELTAALEGRTHPAAELDAGSDAEAHDRAVRMAHLGRPVRLAWTAPAPQVPEAWRSGRMVALYVHAVRAWDLSPSKQEGFDTEPRGPTERLSPGLASLLVARSEAARSARETGDVAAANLAESFLLEAERALRRILGARARLSIARKEAHLDLPDGRRLRLDQLSRGHIAAIGLWAEIFIRVEAARLRADAPGLNPSGLVVIDAPEADLDVRLQRELLPLLSELFESVQLVVATHSPLVALSLDDAVVFDLPRREARSSASVRREGLESLLARMISESRQVRASSVPPAEITASPPIAKPPRRTGERPRRRAPARLGKSAEMSRPAVADAAAEHVGPDALDPERRPTDPGDATSSPMAPPRESVVPMRGSTTPPAQRTPSVPPPGAMPPREQTGVPKDTVQTSPVQTGPAQTGPAQTSPAQISPAQTSPAQTSPAQTSAVPKDTLPTNTIPSPPPDQEPAKKSKRPRQTTLEGPGPWSEEK